MKIKHSHKFADEFKGFVGFGLNRESDENTVVYYLQKFSDDNLMKTIKKRLTNDDLEKIFDTLSELLSKYLTESEYHQLFLKE